MEGSMSNGKGETRAEKVIAREVERMDKQIADRRSDLDKLVADRDALKGALETLRQS